MLSRLSAIRTHTPATTVQRWDDVSLNNGDDTGGAGAVAAAAAVVGCDVSFHNIHTGFKT